MGYYLSLLNEMAMIFLMNQMVMISLVNRMVMISLVNLRVMIYLVNEMVMIPVCVNFDFTLRIKHFLKILFYWQKTPTNISFTVDLMK